MSWFGTAVITAKAAKSSYDLYSSKSFQRFRRRINYWIRHRSAVVPVFGAGGVGKSTLPRFFTESAETILSSSIGYQESSIVETVSLTGDIPGKIIVAPGQQRRVAWSWPTLYSEITTKKAQGFVNIVSYGFHSPGFNNIADNELYVEGMTTEEFLSVYVDSKRKLELDLLRTLLGALSGVQRPLWFATIVTKQDLWWNSRNDVMKHYENGEYGQMVTDFQSKIGKSNFQHEFISASFTLQNMKTLSGEVLVETAAGYDFEMYNKARSYTIKNFNDLLGRGKIRNG